MVLSADPEQDPNSLAIVGAAAALAISDIPFPYVLGGVRVGMKDGQYIANPTYTEGRESKLNIVVAGTEEGIVMVEAGAQQVSEAEVLGAIEFGHECCKKIAAAIRELVKLAGKPKRVFTPPALDQALYDAVAKQAREELTDALNTQKYPKLESYARVADLKKRVLEAQPEEKRDEAGKCYRRAQGADLPRRDAEEPPPSGRPRVRRNPARSPSKPACCRAPTARRCSPAARRRRW